jgi:hypothetical protein
MTVLPVHWRIRSSSVFIPGVVEGAGQQPIGLEQQRVRDGVQLPEAEVPRNEQHALALPVREADAVLAVHLDAGKHLLPRERAELQRLERLRDEMRERAAGRSPGVRPPNAREMPRPRFASAMRRRDRLTVNHARPEPARPQGTISAEGVMATHRHEGPHRGRTRASASLRPPRQPHTFEEPGPELVNRLDVADSGTAAMGRLAQVADREPHRVLVGRQHDRGRTTLWQQRQSARRRGRVN